MLLAIKSLSVDVSRAIEHRLGSEMAANSSVAVLGSLGRGGEVRPKDLLAQIPMTSGGLSKLLDRLEGDGLIERVPASGDDLRAVSVTLTRQGWEAHHVLVSTIKDGLARSGPELEQVLQVCAQLDQRASVHEGEPSDVELAVSMAGLGLEIFRALEAASGPGTPTDLLPILVLAAIRLEGPVRPGRVSELTDLSSGGATKLIGRMARQGLITRTRRAVAGDHRAVDVDTTERGSALLDAVLDALASQIQPIHDVMRPAGRVLGL